MTAFKWDLDLGQILVAAAMLANVAAYVASGHENVSHLATDVQDTKKQIDQTQLQLSNKIQETKTDLTAQIQKLSTAIDNLPDVRAKGVELEHRESSLERRADETDTKISDLSTRVTKVEASMQQPSYRTPR